MRTGLTPMQWEHCHAFVDSAISAFAEPFQQTEVETAYRTLSDGLGGPLPVVKWASSPIAAIKETARQGGPTHSPLSNAYTAEIKRSAVEERFLSYLLSAWEHDLIARFIGEIGEKCDQQITGPMLNLQTHINTVGYEHLIPFREYAWASAAEAALQVSEADPEIIEQVSAWRALNRSALWSATPQGLVASATHTHLSTDRQGRLHNGQRAAWLWEDGTSVHALEGVNVPEWAVTCTDPARLISDLSNLTERRVAIDNYGWERLISVMGLSPIDAASDPKQGTLYEVPMDPTGRTPIKVLIVENASPSRDGGIQTFGLLPNPEARTVTEAQASLAGMTVAQYRLMSTAT